MAPHARRLIKDFHSTCIELWSPRGDTTMLALVLQAIGGPLSTDGAVWSKPEEVRCVAVLKTLRSQAELATVGSCLWLVDGWLFQRTLLLFLADAGGALD
jgi:hypothetical protein